MSITRISFLISSLILFEVFSFNAFAVQAQPVPIAEDPSIMPQINISGVGITTLSYAKNAEMTSGKSAINIGDSALQIGAAQKLYEHGAVGSFGIGGVTSEDTNKGSSLFLHQAFVDYQSANFEALIGRSDNPTAHLVDFPTLRGDDLITLTNPLNPFSNGQNVDEHRYSNLASITFNQNLKYFENVHVQHLINSNDPNSDSGLNSFGAAFGYLGAPGMESFESFPSFGIGYEYINMSGRGLNQIYAGGTATIRKSVTNKLELGFQDLVSLGSDLRAFSSLTDTFTADSNAIAASLRYLHTPFGKAGFQIALTGAYKSYMKVEKSLICVQTV